MSGIVGILNRDGAPMDRDLLGEMTGFMTFRGPDAQQVWMDGAAGLGHTLLRTTWESDREKQPCTLDGRVWIAADARVDARSELIDKLKSAGHLDAARATDPELILHAYDAWGQECLRHLLGDFAFILWDSRQRLLFCARDHFGVKPLYYAGIGRSLLVSNTLNTLRLHPQVSDKLNDLAVADFLLFDGNEDPATTTFADIQRVPPGHSLVCSGASLEIKPYWTLPAGSPIRYRRAYDYVDHFRGVFGAAVKDRLRSDRVTVFMSGGIDSTLTAAVANQILGKPSGHAGVRAYTVVADRIIPDQERKYSRLAADFMHIPIEYLAGDDYEPYAGAEFSKPEPDHNVFEEMERDQYRGVGEYSRVALTGLGGDPCLSTNEGYIADFLKIGELSNLMTGLGWCLWTSRRVPRLGIRSLLKRKFGRGKPPYQPPYPAWLNPDLEQRFELRSRWDRLNPPVDSRDPRSEARQILQAPLWASMFEFLDPGVIQFPIEQRHPFFDLRVVTHLISLPPLPWCQEKNLLKAAAGGLLPPLVRFRPKATLAGDPVWEHLRDCGPDWWGEHFNAVPELEQYANSQAVSGATFNLPGELWTNLRLVSLNYWLQSGRKSRRIRGQSTVSLNNRSKCESPYIK